MESMISLFERLPRARYKIYYIVTYCLILLPPPSAFFYSVYAVCSPSHLFTILGVVRSFRSIRLHSFFPSFPAAFFRQLLNVLPGVMRAYVDAPARFLPPFFFIREMSRYAKHIYVSSTRDIEVD